MSRILRSRRAQRDFIEIWTYIAGDDADAATSLLERLDGQARFLAEFPKIGTPRFDLGLDLRSFVVGNYLIFYRPIPDGIRIVRILNAARDVRRALRR